ncbi:Serine/threonine-protein kinase stk11 [Chytridiales sp. JEL 0842]|nr:Serine/threonine-protein kinase stk11 [Chytridiales sp. JEL 0842]
MKREETTDEQNAAAATTTTIPTTRRSSTNSVQKDGQPRRVVMSSISKRSSADLSFRGSRITQSVGRRDSHSSNVTTGSTNNNNLGASGSAFKTSSIGLRIEKPTILMYPRKSVMVSSHSMATGIHDQQQNNGEDIRRLTSTTSVGVVGTNSGPGTIGRDHVTAANNSAGAIAAGSGVSGVYRSRSSWSVKGSMGLRSGMASSRSMGNVRHPKFPSDKSVIPHIPAIGDWDYGQTAPEKTSSIDQRSVTSPVGSVGSVRFADQGLSARESISRASNPRESEISRRTSSRDSRIHTALSSGQSDHRPEGMVGPGDANYHENPEYYEYLLISQRHASSNFITKLDSADIVYPTESAPVKVIGPYVLGDKIGKGSFGKVKEGICSETLQRVAIKIINKKRLRKIQNGVENVLREIKMLKKMKHTNIITLIDVYCKVEDDDGNVGIFNWFSSIEDEPIIWTYDDGTQAEKKVEILKWYLIFEYCPCSLQTLLEQAEGKNISISMAHRFFRQLMDGLEYLHSQSIIHRDIKPGNMLISADGVLKISDFGVAEQFSIYESGDMVSQIFAGTHQFICPEIAEGALEFVGVKVDIWACGVTLYNMLTGRYPFEFDEEGNLLALYDKIIAAEFEMPSEISADSDLHDLVRGMLTKDPLLRYSMPQILSHPWTLSFFPDSLKHPPILSYPLSDADSPTTPTSPVKKLKHHQKPPKPESTAAMEQVTPCETTMVPYLEQLFAAEIEDDLSKTGRIESLGDIDTNSRVSFLTAYRFIR